MSNGTGRFPVRVGRRPSLGETSHGRPVLVGVSAERSGRLPGSIPPERGGLGGARSELRRLQKTCLVI